MSSFEKIYFPDIIILCFIFIFKLYRKTHCRAPKNFLKNFPKFEGGLDNGTK